MQVALAFLGNAFLIIGAGLLSLNSSPSELKNVATARPGLLQQAECGGDGSSTCIIRCQQLPFEACPSGYSMYHKGVPGNVEQCYCSRPYTDDERAEIDDTRCESYIGQCLKSKEYEGSCQFARDTCYSENLEEMCSEKNLENRPFITFSNLGVNYCQRPFPNGETPRTESCQNKIDQCLSSSQYKFSCEMIKNYCPWIVFRSACQQGEREGKGYFVQHCRKHFYEDEKEEEDEKWEF